MAAFEFSAALPAFAQEEPGESQEEAAPAPVDIAPKSSPAAPAKAKPARKTPAPAPVQAQAKPAAKPAASATPVWPAGASSVTEVYGSWTLNCASAENDHDCTINQAQANSQSRERRVAIELKLPKEGRSAGTIIVPLGVQLEPGATLMLDEQKMGADAVPFLACVVQGCVLPISLPTVATDAMRKGQKLVVNATVPGASPNVSFAFPLDGFGPALDRMRSIGGDASAKKE